MADSTVPNPILDIEIQMEVPTEVDSTLKSTKDNNHYYLWVIDPESKEEVLVYVDTSIQDILYDPITFRGDYKSNYSVVMILKEESPNVYTISNAILPENGLIRGEVVQATDTTYRANINYKESVKFTQLLDPNGSKKYAFYTLIDNDPNKRAYLLPIVDSKQTGHRSKTIRIVLGDQSADGKYLFEKKEITGYTRLDKVEVFDKTTQTEKLVCDPETRESGGCCLIL